MDKQLLYMRDELKLLKDAGSHEEYNEYWIEDGQFTDWHKHSAVPPKKKAASPAKKHFPRQIQAESCIHENCDGSIYKAGLCEVHWKEQHREKNRLYRAKRRAVLKAAKAAEAPKKKPAMRFCSECGKPAYEKANNNLCYEHFTAYMRTHQQRRDAETDAIIEASTARKTALLDRLWAKTQARYDNHENQPD